MWVTLLVLLTKLTFGVSLVKKGKKSVRVEKSEVGFYIERKILKKKTYIFNFTFVYVFPSEMRLSFPLSLSRQ